MNTLLGNLADIAIERLQEFEPEALAKHPDGYYVAYSGGKDSDVILDLVRRSGVKYTAHHHLTTCDPPELVWHVKEQADVVIERPKRTMWQLIRHKGFLPTGFVRYCCALLKEPGGTNRIIGMGVRWEESANRANRKMLETCRQNKTKQYLNAIIEWTTGDVWNYIRGRKINYCNLYDEGFKRLGCALCPMCSAAQAQREAARWPRIAAAWYRAGKSVFDASRSEFDTYDEMWQWWMERKWPKGKKDDTIMMFED